MTFYNDANPVNSSSFEGRHTELEVFNKKYSSKLKKVLCYLKGMRTFAGLTKRNLADKLEVKESFIERLENGQEDVTYERIEQYAHFCNLSTELRIFDESEVKNSYMDWPDGFTGKKV